MIDERLIKDMARIDGINIPDYLNDHNAVQRVIDSLCILDTVRYGKKLYEVCKGHCGGDKIYKATPRQKCEAIFRAINWLEDEEFFKEAER